MSKKGQGLSLNTIIIAALVLVVLVVLWAIFTGRMGLFAEKVKAKDVETAKQEKAIQQTLTGDCSAAGIIIQCTVATPNQQCNKGGGVCGKCADMGTPTAPSYQCI